MKLLDIENWNRYKTYQWFKNFSNSTYSMNVKMDVTKLKEHTDKTNQSFFIDLLYIVLKGLNSVEEMRMRLINDNPVIYDEINPAFTVMTESETFENVRYKNNNNFLEFYEISSQNINTAKHQSKIKNNSYNSDNCYDEYYITCIPWVDFTQFVHPIPDDKSSQCIPRICWGKYTKSNDKYELTLNITVSHIFVDGFHLAKTFNIIQDLLNSSDIVLR